MEGCRPEYVNDLHEWLFQLILARDGLIMAHYIRKEVSVFSPSFLTSPTPTRCISTLKAIESLRSQPSRFAL
jgi:hypothetical protein